MLTNQQIDRIAKKIIEDNKYSENILDSIKADIIFYYTYITEILEEDFDDFED